METAELRAAIESAFGRLRIPDPDSVFYKNSAPVEGAESQEIGEGPQALVRMSFAQIKTGGDIGKIAGKRWQDVELGVFKRSQYSFWRLRPRAYRYYLPALLIAALFEEAPDDYGGLITSVVSDLVPEFWYLYYGESDPKLRAHQRLFTDAQYRAVVAFLGKAFEGGGYVRYCAMQALYWGWNRIKTPELASATDYYHSLRNYTYPIPDDPAVAALFQEIETAFAETPYPGDGNICEENGFADPDFAEYATEFRGVKWQQVHPELLARSDASFSFFSEGAFRYYLPAALLMDLSGYESNINPVFHLTYGFETEKYDSTGFLNYLRSAGEDEPYIERVRQDHERDPTEMRPGSIWRWSGFTVPERRAIISYLEYQTTIDEYNALTIQNALDQYWRPSLEAC